jgi:hypothetical protein
MPLCRFITPVLLLAVICTSTIAAAELPLAPTSARGQTVTPSFEGWYKNPDGSFTLSFGYFNRNTEEVVEIPVGPDNFIEPGDANQGQPTAFLPRRHWGVFGVRVPADFGYERVVWTLKIQGQTFSIPGALNRDWEVDALEGEAGSNNTPPVMKIGDITGQGPGGLTGTAMATKVGSPLEVTVWAADDGKPVGNVARQGVPGMPVNVTWFKHQGPGEVSFSEDAHKVDYKGGTAKTTVSFSEPGNYLLRVHAVDASGQDHEGEEELAMSGYAQCCWTNGFIPVTVNR